VPKTKCVGAPKMVKVAVAEFPGTLTLPAVTVPVVFTYLPDVEAVTLTVSVQLPPGAMVAPL
jgi:hypothetical protein